jgi:MATE family multidrug resistance protein
LIRNWVNGFSQPITRGDLWTLIRISLPLMLFLFCDSLTVFTERIFLSHFSTDGVPGSLNATYLASLFQSPCIAIAAMGQVFVGLYQGSGELKRIGPCVWQLIWFSVFSLVITLPLSIWASEFYFKDTTIHQAGTEYFSILALGNFLFPLSIALSSFYLGRGKTVFVTSIMLTSYALNLVLSWLLVFGIEGLIPSLGIKGAALAKCVGLGIACSVFLWSFLMQKHRELYSTNEWRFSPTTLWSYMQPGLVRAFGFLSTKVCWVAITYIMIQKGGKYLDVLTIGGTIVTFLVFIPAGLYRATLTISSNLLGGKNYAEIGRLFRSFSIYTLLIGAMLTIPLLVFPTSMICFFDLSSQQTFKETFSMIHHWIWLYMVFLTIQMSICALIVSARDLKLQFYCYLFLFLTSFLPVYLTMHQGNWQPDKLWLIMACENLIVGSIFFLRFRQRNKENQQLIYLKN